MQEHRVSIPARDPFPAGELNVWRGGQGPSLLLIHGFPLHAGMWQNQLDELHDRFELIAPDLRGFGKSSALAENWTVADFARDLAIMIRELGVGPIIPVGLSLGGYIAFELVDRFPDLISQLVLCNTRAAADDETTARARKWMAERVRWEGTGFVMESMLPRLLAEENQERVLNPTVKTFFDDANAESIALTQIAMSERRDFSDRLDRIQCPTQVIAGDDDKITPATEMKEMAERIPSATFHTIGSAGHLTPIENPAEFNEVLVSRISQFQQD